MDAPNIDAVVNEQQIQYASPSVLMVRQMIVRLQRIYDGLESGIISQYIGSNGSTKFYQPTAMELDSKDPDFSVAIGLTGEYFMGGSKDHRIPNGSVLLKYSSPLFYATLVDTPQVGKSVDIIYLARKDQDAFLYIKDGKIQRVSSDKYGNNRKEPLGMLPVEVQRELDNQYENFVSVLGQVVKWRLKEKRDSLRVEFRRKTPPRGKEKR